MHQVHLFKDSYFCRSKTYNSETMLLFFITYCLKETRGNYFFLADRSLEEFPSLQWLVHQPLWRNNSSTVIHFQTWCLEVRLQKFPKCTWTLKQNKYLPGEAFTFGSEEATKLSIPFSCLAKQPGSATTITNALQGGTVFLFGWSDCIADHIHSSPALLYLGSYFSSYGKLFHSLSPPALRQP